VTTRAPTGAPCTSRLTTLVYARVDTNLHRSFEVITPSAVTLVADDAEGVKSRSPR
jgi:hypothetical protein